jgi:hypothetical protein
MSKLIALDHANTFWFAHSLAINEEADTVVVGAYRDPARASEAGASYIFERNQGGTNNWGQAKKLFASDAASGDNFGMSVAISGDVVVVGALRSDDHGPDSGSAYLFERNLGGANNWGEVSKLTASDAASEDNFGDSVSISGNVLIVGASANDSLTGSAYQFERNEGGADNWGEVSKLTASDAASGHNFGRSVAISGDIVVIGAFSHDGNGANSGSAYVYAPPFSLTCSDTEFYPGDTLPVDLIAEGADVYGLQADCAVDPAIAQPGAAVFGDFFTSPYLVGTNQTDAAAGPWLGAVSQQNPNGPITGSGIFATLPYTATSAGTTDITCDSLFSDRDGFEIASLSEPACTLTVVDYATISGTVNYQGRLAHDNIEVTVEMTPTASVTGTASTDAVGDFEIGQLRAGDYQMKADAPSYLPACSASDVALTSGQSVSLPQITLLGGDVNDDVDSGLIINIGDLSRLGGSFNEDASVDPQADINNDGTINIQDLSILGGNYNISGCQAWPTS